MGYHCFLSWQAVKASWFWWVGGTQWVTTRSPMCSSTTSRLVVGNAATTCRLSVHFSLSEPFRVGFTWQEGMMRTRTCWNRHGFMIWGRTSRRVDMNELGTGRVRRGGDWVVVFSFLLWTAVDGGGGGSGWLCCAVLVFFFFFWVDVFIIILMSYMYYFNQIAINIAPLLWGVIR